jgi:hypothetical protein
MLRLAAVVMLALAALAVGAAWASPPVRIGVVCVGATGPAHGGQVRPTSVMLACADANYWIAALKWKGWGTATATTAGKVHYNDCTPYCAAGHFHVIPGTATLSNLKAGKCDGAAARFYTRLRVVTGRRGKNIPAAVDETLLAHC